MVDDENSIHEAAELGEGLFDERFGSIEAVLENQESLPLAETLNFGNFIIFADETGDVGLKNVDTYYPYFAINFCIFKKNDYLEYSKKLNLLKIRYFNCDTFIFHDVEISQKCRKMSAYKFHNNRSCQLLAKMNDATFLNFMKDFSDLLKETQYKQITALVDKRVISLGTTSSRALKYKQDELYKQTLITGLFGVCKFLESEGEQNKKTCIVFEESGSKENTTIKSIFYDFYNMDSDKVYREIRLEYEVAPKQSNNAGLQLADMTAKASVNIFSGQNKSDRTCDIIREKLLSDNGEILGHGLLQLC